MNVHTEPVATSGDIPAFFFVSAHGGAGASTLAKLIAPAGDAGTAWPVHDVHPFVYVVASAAVDTLDRAHQTLASIPEEITCLGLVVVNPAPGKPSRAVTAKLRVLRNLVEVYEAPYLKGVRELALSDLPEWTPGMDSAPRLRRVKNSISQPFSQFADRLCAEFVRSYNSHKEDHND